MISIYLLLAMCVTMWLPVEKVEQKEKTFFQENGYALEQGYASPFKPPRDKPGWHRADGEEPVA